MKCLGDKLPPRWYRYDGPCPCGADHKVIEHELAAHDNNRTDAAKAHGIKPDTVAQGWRSLGLSKLPPGPKLRKLQAVPDEAVSREEILDAEVKELRALLRKQRAADVGEERILELVAQIVPAKEPIYKPATPITKLATGYTPHEFLLLWSDLHAAEVVSAEQMNGINEYDWQIMLRRHDEMIRALRSFRDKMAYPVPRLQIAALGDMVTGDIHEELAITNDRTVLESAIQLGLDGAEFIEALVPDFERIDVDGVVGNHGRRSKKPQAKNAHDNYDWLVYHLLKLRLAKYPSVTVNVPKSAFHPIKMCGRWTCLMLHGDGIRSTMPGVPWGGVARRTRELERQFEPSIGHIDHFLTGHFHQDNVADGRRVIMNGSVKGPDEYSIKQFGGGCEPVQLLNVFHPKRGLVATHPLRLGEDVRAADTVRLRAVA